ncbi:MAG TPA: hypothetical protein H9887_04890 [Candidatus Dorea intestinavium]|nr:hypothetical protein [Candidatus Dorea intestinavium]
MEELTLSRQYAILALDGQDSLHDSLAKSAVLRAVAAALVLEAGLEKEKVEEAVFTAKGLKKREAKKLENEIVLFLKEEDLLEEVPDILGCDINYYTAGLELKAYRSEKETYVTSKEGLRKELLEEQEPQEKTILLLWLLRESGCLHELFSALEQEKVQEKMLALTLQNELYKLVWEAQFHSSLESLSSNFLKAKSNLFKNPFLQGINLAFPYLERRKAIFIDMVVLNTTVMNRREQTINFLKEMGQQVEEMKKGEMAVLKINNALYQIFPMTKRYSMVPVQGVYLVPIYY